ncbi:hypothetical protein E2L06_04110 [Haloterrigena sp. H1]|uniref:hypothetical protein n=1 Tax=Haloterrigena sp. H1 TaxID=2552943 RepID=UPI00110E5F6C|nr:hypothetical protein [Haloterrigena sp. H1]TMT85818.1 hypothetical protein E2L06_04110 [Haloterrigena sp. H1]
MGKKFLVDEYDAMTIVDVLRDVEDDARAVEYAKLLEEHAEEQSFPLTPEIIELIQNSKGSAKTMRALNGWHDTVDGDSR